MIVLLDNIALNSGVTPVMLCVSGLCIASSLFSWLRFAVRRTQRTLKTNSLDSNQKMLWSRWEKQTW